MILVAAALDLVVVVVVVVVIATRSVGRIDTHSASSSCNWQCQAKPCTRINSSHAATRTMC